MASGCDSRFSPTFPDNVSLPVRILWRNYIGQSKTIIYKPGDMLITIWNHQGDMLITKQPHSKLIRDTGHAAAYVYMYNYVGE